VIVSIDTNILVYTQDSRDPVKQRISTDLFMLASKLSNAKVGLQVLGELYTVLTRKLKQDPSTARQVVESVSTLFEPFGYSEDNVFAALNLAESGAASYWDGLVLSAAESAGCSILISEDLQNEFSYGGLKVISPFSDGKPNLELFGLLEAAR